MNNQKIMGAQQQQQFVDPPNTNTNTTLTPQIKYYQNGDLSNKFSKYFKTAGVKPVLGEKKYSPLHSALEYTDFEKAKYLEADLKQLNLFCIDIDIKADAEFERDYYLDEILHNLKEVEENAYVEYSKNKGIHIYIKQNSPLPNKLVYKLPSTREIEILIHKAIITDNAHRKSFYSSFYEFLNTATQITEQQQLDILNYFETTYTNKKEYIRQQQTNTNTKATADDIKTTKRIKFYNYELINRIGVKEVLEALNIDYKEYNNYYTIFSLVEDDGHNMGVMIYKNSGVVIDFHTGEKYNFLDYIKHHDFFSNYKNVDEAVKQIFTIKNVLFTRYTKNKKMSFEVKYKKIKIDEYINTDDIAEILNTEKKVVQIKAATGSGKTTAIINYFINNKNKSVIITFPYRLQVEQLQKNYGANRDFEFLYAGQQHNNSKRVVITTYDSIIKISNVKDYDYFIVDEAHNIFKQKNFRTFAINNIINNSNNEKQTYVYITATPQCLFTENDDAISYEFVKNSKSKNYKQSKLIYTNEYNDKIDYIIKNHKNNMIDAILINDVEEIKLLSNKLKQMGYKIATAFSEKDREREVDELTKQTIENIINNESIDNNIDFLLTTNVLLDGININNKNIDNVYFIKKMDVVSVLQFAGRFRSGFNALVIFTKKQEANETPAFTFNYIDIYNKYYKQLNTQVNGHQKIIDDNISNTHFRIFIKSLNEYIKTNFLYRRFNIYKYIKLNSENNELMFDINLLQYDIYIQFLSLTTKNNLFNLFLDNYSIEEYTAKNDDFSAIKKELHKSKEETKKEIKGVLNSVDKLLTATKVILQDDNEYTQQVSVLKYKTFENENNTDFIEEAKELYSKNKKQVKRYLLRMLHIYKILSFDDIKKLEQEILNHLFLQGKHYQSFITKIQLSIVNVLITNNKINNITNNAITNIINEINTLKREVEKYKNKNINEFYSQIYNITNLSKTTIESVILKKKTRNNKTTFYSVIDVDFYKLDEQSILEKFDEIYFINKLKIDCMFRVETENEVVKNNITNETLAFNMF